jgi:type III secretion protein T
MTDNYVTMFFNNALLSQDPGAILILLFLFMARILPIIALSPFLGARVLPHPVKVTFALSLFAIFLPHLLQVTTTKLTFNITSLVYFTKEMFIGFSIGFLMSIPFTIVQCTGMFIDHQRGGASLMVNDPTIQNQSSPLGTLFNFVLIYLFFIIDGPFLFIDAIIQSYDVIPPDKLLSSSFFEKNTNFWKVQMQLMQTTTRIATQLAAPALIAILMTDVFLGIANRLATQVQITFLGMPLKSLLALTVLCIGWKVFTDQMVTESYSWLNTINNMILNFKPPINEK